MASPADLLGQILENLGVVTTVDASVTPTVWRLRKGRRTDVPHKQVVLVDTGGSSPNTKWLVDFVHVQAIVRGDPMDYSGAFSKALAVKDALLGLDSQDVTFGGDTVRIDGITMLADISILGYDDADRPMFSVNFRVIQERASSPNRASL